MPDETHLFSYHPDEYFSLQAAIGLFANQDPNPHFFNYPSLYLYLAAAGCLIAHGSMPLDDLSQLPAVLRSFTLDARIVTVLLALGTVLVTYGVARRLAGRRAGILAALAVAVAPGHVLYSHFAAVDIALTFFMVLALFAAMALAVDERLKAALLAGAAVGAATATKYNGALMLLAPLTVLGQRFRRDRDARRSTLPRVVAVVLTAIVAFAVLSPYVFLDWPSASRDISYERDHMRQGEYPAKAADPCGWWFHLRALGYAVGGAVPLLALVALFGIGIRARWPSAAPILIVAALWFAVIGATGVRYARYGLPLVPLLAIGASAGVIRLAMTRRNLPARLGAALLFVPGLLTSSFLSGSLAFEPEPRDVALAEFQQMASPGDEVGLTRTVWFDMPPLDYNNGADALGSNPIWRGFRRTPYNLDVIPGFDDKELLGLEPMWFVESDFQFADWIRAGDAKAVGFRNALETHYRLEAEVKRKWGWFVLGPCGPLPHDWSYPFTTVRIWRLRPPPQTSPPEEQSAPEGT